MSASFSSSSFASSSCPLPLVMPSVQQFTTPITLKLDEDNYLLWKHKVLASICGLKLGHFLDDTSVPSRTTSSTTDESPQVSNGTNNKIRSSQIHLLLSPWYQERRQHACRYWCPCFHWSYWHHPWRLSEEYNTFITVVISRTDPYIITEIEALLFAREERFTRYKLSQSNLLQSNIAFVASSQHSQSQPTFSNSSCGGRGYNPTSN